MKRWIKKFIRFFQGKAGFVSMLLKAGAHINLQQHNEETALILVRITILRIV